MREYCLNLVCPTTAQEGLLDTVLESEGIDVFSSQTIDEHGASTQGFSASEQVLGRTRATHVQVLLGEEAMTLLLARIGKRLPGVGIRYWATPVASEGEIR